MIYTVASNQIGLLADLDKVPSDFFPFHRRKLELSEPGLLILSPTMESFLLRAPKLFLVIQCLSHSGVTRNEPDNKFKLILLPEFYMQSFL